MKDRKNSILLWAAALLPFLMVAAVWVRLPVQVPTHWGFSGSADQYSPRWVLWMLAAANPLICLLMAFFLKADPKSGNYQKFRGSYWVFQFAMALFLDALMALTLLETLRPGTVNISVAMQLFIAVLLMVVGNMMPKFRQTYFCGIKTPWTLASERVWTRTHRLGGRLYFVAGICVFAGAFAVTAVGFAVLLAAIIAASVIPAVMSYVWFRQEQKGQAQ